MRKKEKGFVDDLTKAYDTNARNDIKMVLGEINAQVDKKPVNFPTVGN
jgi:hypothetical protein